MKQNLYVVAFIKFQKGNTKLDMELKQEIVFSSSKEEAITLILQRKIFGAELALITATEIKTLESKI